MSIESEIRRLVDQETEAWNRQDAEALVSVFPDMVWPWPPDAGLDRSLDHDEGPLAALKWGLTHQYVSYDWQYIRRFESVVPFSPSSQAQGYLPRGVASGAGASGGARPRGSTGRDSSSVARPGPGDEECEGDEE